MINSKGFLGGVVNIAVILLFNTSMSFAQVNTYKTLVSWVSLDNLSQQGGSALTIQLGDKFDGIVFGEITPGKWMAGSNNFSRTSKDQEKWLSETTVDPALIQMAVVYSEDQISLYRNGILYASYKANNIDLLDTDYNIVVFGLRHIGAGKGNLSGAIEDARIYDKALSIEDLNSLKPDEASNVAPYAWWNFEGDEFKDLTGRFEYNRLKDGAQISGGKLLLGDKSVAVAARSEEAAEKAVKGDVPSAPLPPWLGEKPEMPERVPENWLSYHLAHPGPGVAMPGDPNCAFYYKGLYHLHYIYINKHGFAFAHVSSKDMVTWKWHETVLVPPNTGHGMFSGTGFFTKEGKPAIIYHGQGSDKNFISFAEDDMLDVWSKPMPLEPKTAEGEGVKIRQWDPDCWLNGDTYYSISGGAPPHLAKSDDLKNWTSLDLLLHEDMPDLGVSRDEDVSCANMFKIGDKWMLLCISHSLGCRYYLGDFKDEKYLPEFHAMMNWNGWDFFAPESMLTKDGRRVMWAWCLLDGAQSGIQSLPRELSLPDDGILRIKPLRELEKLRFDQTRENKIKVASGDDQVLKTKGDIIELTISIDPTTASEYGVRVFCDEQGKGLPISIIRDEKIMMIGEKKVPFELAANESLNLRVFLDHGMVEVFLNDRQAVNYMQIHDKEDVGIRLFTRGDEIKANVKSWRMHSIY